jgi:hypothetical protein
MLLIPQPQILSTKQVVTKKDYQFQFDQKEILRAKRKYFSTHNPCMVNSLVYENNVLIHSTSFRVIEFNV